MYHNKAGSETQTMPKMEENLLEDVKSKVYSTNKDALERIEEERRLMRSLRQREISE